MRRQIEFNVLATIATNFFDFMHLEIAEKNCRSWPCYFLMFRNQNQNQKRNRFQFIAIDVSVSERETNKISRWKQFHFEMFAFLSQFLDVNPSIYLIICCSTLLLWLYLVHDEFFNSDAHQTSRLDVYLVHEKKQTRKIPNHFNHQEIPWIQGNARFRLPFPHAFHANNTFLYLRTASIECNRFSTNIETNFAEKFFTWMPLMWNGFMNQPTRMLFQNTGYDGNCMQMTKICVSFLSKLAAHKKKRTHTLTHTHAHRVKTFPFDLRTASAS